MSTNKTVEYAIFDVDGTLLDTESIYTDVTGNITRKYGKEFPWEVKKEMMGKTPLEAANILVDKLELPITGAEYLEEEKKVIYDMWPTAKDLPGAIDVVKFLKQSDKIKKIGVATSSLAETFKLKSSRHDWFSLFDTIVTGEMVTKSKPEPDIFLEAAKRISAEPSKTIAFEDSLNGAISAKRAGMIVIAIPHPQEENIEPYRENSDYVLKSLNEFFDIKAQFNL